MADINIKVGLQGAAEVKAQMGYIQAAANSFADKLTNKFVSTFSAVAVGAMAFDKLFESVNKNISAAKQITALSTKFHLDPKAVHSMMIAANNAGVAIRTLLQGMKQLTKYADGAMSKSGGNKDMMKQLFGMDANGKEMQGFEEKIQEISKSPAKFLPEVALALSKINNEQDKTKMGTQLLGRQYQQLIPLLEQLAESEEARNNFLNNGSAMSDEQIEQAKKLGAATSDLANAWDKFAASLFPVLTFLLNGVTLLGSWVEQIKLIGKTWKNEVTQENAKVNDRIVRYETGLRTRALSGNLTEAEKADLKKASEGGMSQEEWINRSVSNYGKTEWDKRREKNSQGGTMLVGVLETIAGGALMATGVGAGFGAYLAGAGVATIAAGAYKESLGTGSIDEEEQAQRDAYDKEIEKRRGSSTGGRLATDHETAMNIERAKKRKQERIEKQYEKFRKNMYEEGGSGNLWNVAKSEKEKRKIIEKTPEYQSALKKVEEQYDQDINLSGWVPSEDDNSAVGQAYNTTKQLGANASEKELNDAILALHLQEKDALAGIMNATGEDYYYDRKTLTFKKGKKPKELPKLKTTELEWKEEAKKKKDLENKYKKSITRGERGQALAEIKANDQTTSEQEAVLTTQMNIENAKQDIEENAPKYSEKIQQKISADADVEKRKEEYRVAKTKQEELDKKVEKAGVLPEGAEKEKLRKEIDALNEEVDKAKGNLLQAEAAAGKASKEENEAHQNLIKSKTDLANSIAAHAKAVEQFWQKERQMKQQARKDEEDWEKHLFDIKYRNMQRLGYSSTQISHEKFIDEVKRYKEAEERKAEYEKELKKKNEAWKAEKYEKEIEEMNLSPEEASAFLAKQPNRVLSDAEKGNVRELQKEVESAFTNVDNALASWESNKPERVVSDLGRVGGGYASQMASADNPTTLLKKQVELQRQLVRNTDNLKALTPNIGNAPMGINVPKSVWGGKRKPLSEISPAIQKALNAFPYPR